MMVELSLLSIMKVVLREKYMFILQKIPSREMPEKERPLLVNLKGSIYSTQVQMIPINIFEKDFTP